MSSELIVTNKDTSVVSQYTTEQMNLITNLLAPGLSKDEMVLFLATAQRLGLDPLQKQIYAIKRGGKMTLTVSIDGYRAKAADSGEHAGTDDAIFELNAKSNCPSKATVTVWKLVGGQRCPFTASARWDEYYPGEGGVGTMWRKMSHTMLGKCAEALALRKAFSRLLTGVYTDVEMEQSQVAVSEPAPKAQTNQAPVATMSLSKMYNSAITAGMTDEEWKKARADAGITTDKSTYTQERFNILANAIGSFTPPGFDDNPDSDPVTDEQNDNHQ